VSVHEAVLARQVVDQLLVDPSGTYVDATLGGGGHSVELARALSAGGRVIGLDRDPVAVEAARDVVRSLGVNVECVHARASQIENVLAVRGIEKVDGVLLDLGISSDQLASRRGFAFSGSGTLDLRFDAGEDRLPAHQWILRAGEDGVAAALRRFGEFPARLARRLARVMLDSVAAAGPDGPPIERFRQELEVHLPVARRPRSLARVFQALRIAVNDELAELEAALAAIARVLHGGARVAVISYHSLEDRLVKRFFDPPPLPHPDRPAPADWPQPAFEWVVRHPITPDDAEVSRNPRSRSAKLRVARRR